MTEPEAGGREAARRRAPLHVQILGGLLVGAVAGTASNRLWTGDPRLDRFVELVAQPMGQVFLRMLFMIVIPLVFTSLALGIAGLGDARRLGRIGGRTLGLFLLTTAAAALLGLTLANLVEPGAALDAGTRARLLTEYGEEAGTRLGAAGTFGVETLVGIVPRNPVDAAARGDMLGVIFFTLVFAIGLTRTVGVLVNRIGR